MAGKAKFISDDDLAHVLRTCRDDDQRLMILAGHRWLLRAAEVAALEWRWLIVADGSKLAGYLDMPSICKGSPSARLATADDLRVVLARVWEREGKPTRGKVLIGPRGASISANSMQARVSRIYAKAGLQGCSSHSGRRSAAMKLLRKLNGDVRSLQVAGRWRYGSSALEYLDPVGDAQINEAMKSLSA